MNRHISILFVLLSERKLKTKAWRNRIGGIILLIFIVFVNISETHAQRFPKPEFESGHTQPPTQIPAPRSDFMEIFDVFVLFAALSVITWLVLKKRSRRGVFYVSIFSILYFGFLREGCVCSVGSLQNIALALFNPGYKIPITVIAFFILPLVFSLFFGRTFCAGVCPLGAIQDVVLWKPVSLNKWLQSALGLIPFIYLGLAVLYAATGTDFIICRYDPFVGIFRFDAEFSMYFLGAIFLITGVFIARPYCRFFCPYGVLLNLFSRVSKYHMTITPSKCIQCKLCENSCPFGAIEYPDELKLKEPKKETIRRFLLLSAIIPALIFVGAWTGGQFHENLAKVHPKVQLAQNILSIPDSLHSENIDIDAFKTAGKPVKQLYAETKEIIKDFHTGGMLLGGFIGLVFGLTLAGLSIYRYRKDYEPNTGTCLSCARCMDYCPVGKDSE